MTTSVLARALLVSASVVIAGAVAGCASAGAAGSPEAAGVAEASPGVAGSRSGLATATDTGAVSIPPGFGTLRQEDIAVRIGLPDVQLRLVPLDEDVLRVLRPDSYRALRGILESRNDEIARLARLRNLRERRVWYVTYYGLGADARFTPTDVTITSGGREFRPVEIIPLTSGFGAQRLQPRESQSALLLFDDGLDVSQPVTVSAGMQRSDAWRDVLRTVERERALIRSRAGGTSK